MGKILKHIGRVFFFLLVLCILGGAGVGFYTYKKTFYDGRFIQGKFSYTKEWKLSYLIKYKENYQKNKSVGFAVVNIPPSFLFSFLLRSDSEQLVNHVGENVGKNFTEEDFKKGYELLSKYCDNHIVNMLF